MAFIKYLWYVLKHKWYVFIECCKLGIPWLGFVHDLSKFLPSEFFPYARYFYGGKPKRNNEGIYKLDDDAKFNYAWLLHQKRNQHHWQFWILIQDNDDDKILPIPDRYRREMLADWRGAGRAITGEDNTKTWYIKRQARFIDVLHPETRNWIEDELEKPLFKMTTSEESE